MHFVAQRGPFDGVHARASASHRRSASFNSVKHMEALLPFIILLKSEENYLLVDAHWLHPKL